jgi:predicted ATPase/DNA-binding CsgD family transcriptional regulator
MSRAGMEDSVLGRTRELRLVKVEGGAMRAPGRESSAASPDRPRRPGNVPFPVSSFVGRVVELEEAWSLLTAHRLLTLIGGGGCGKTRLAVELAQGRESHFPQGARFVDLAAVHRGELVLPEIAAVLGVEEPERGSTIAEALVGHLGVGRFLVVLDNCEHLTDAAASAAAALLHGAPGLKILATSRAPLSLPGEVTWTVPELGDPEALALFVERAREAKPGLALDAGELTVIGDICRQLDGLPLAIELAAARARVLSPTRIASALREHFDLLSGTTPHRPGRQGTLRASFEWSYDLLSEGERELLAQLAVFAGGFAVDDVLAVCPAATIGALAGLADRSLLAVHTEQGGEPRYRMLETVRGFAAEHLAATPGEAARIRRRHCEHYLALAEAAEPELTRHAQDEWLTRLAANYDNLRSALAWSRREPAPELCARLTASLTPYWLERSQWSECRLWLEAAAGPGPLPAALRARVLNGRCYLEIWAGDPGVVPALANESLALLEGRGELVEEGRAHGFLGLVIALGPGPEVARPHVERALELTRAGGDDWGLAMALAFFANTRLLQAGPDEPRRMLDEAIEIATSAGDRRTLRHALSMASLAAITQGRIAEASRRAQRAADSARQAGHASPLILAMFVQAWAQLLEGDPDAAATTARHCLAVARETGEGGERPALWLLAAAALAAADPLRAMSLLEEALELTDPALSLAGLSALPVLATAEALLVSGDRDGAAAAADHVADVATASGRIWILGRVHLLRARIAEDPMMAESEVLAGVAEAREAGDALGLVDAVELLAALAMERGDDTEALRLRAAASTARARLGYARIASADMSDHDPFALLLDGANAETTRAAWAQGQQLSIEEALAYASRGHGRRRRPAAGWPSLTPAEVAVARLVARHLSNPEIAERLFISRATVKTHLVHTFAKLNLRSRSELAAEAVKRGLG